MKHILDVIFQYDLRPVLNVNISTKDMIILEFYKKHNVNDNSSKARDLSRKQIFNSNS